MEKKEINLYKLEHHQLALSYALLQVWGQVPSFYEFHKSKSMYYEKDTIVLFSVTHVKTNLRREKDIFKQTEEGCGMEMLSARRLKVLNASLFGAPGSKLHAQQDVCKASIGPGQLPRAEPLDGNASPQPLRD